MNDINALNGKTVASEQLKTEMVSLLFKDKAKSFIISLVIASILLAVLSDDTSTKLIAFWSILMVTSYSLRFFVGHLYTKNKSKSNNSQVWLNRFRITSALCGLAWGSVGYFIFPSGNIPNQTFLALVLGGISAGALINYSVDNITAKLFVGSTLILIAPFYLIEQDSLSKIIYAITVIFVLYMAFASKRLAQGLLSNVSLRIDAVNSQKEIAKLSKHQSLHLEHTPMGVIEWDGNLHVVAWNKACVDIFGYKSDEAIGKHISFFMPNLVKMHTQQAVEKLDQEKNNLKQMHKNSGEVIYCEWLNTVLRNPQGEMVGLASLVQNKTDFIASQEQIYQLAYFDTLTGLPNRGLLIDRINQALASSKRSKSYSMLAFIDLDHFKAINDIKGHIAGDHLLKVIATRLKDNMRQQDTAARIGGDEFVLVLSNVGDSKEQAQAYSNKIMQKIMHAIKMPLEFDDYQHQCSASIGVCLFNDDSLDATELLRRADVSMYLSKKQGRNAYQFYDESQQPKYEYQLKLKHDLNHAIESDQFVLNLQGQYDRSSEIIGAEVLLRWQHPELGLVMPNDFISLAEETGAIVPIGAWVLKQACNLLRKWQNDESSAHLMIAVNVSAIQFNHPDFVEHIEFAINKSGCDATKLCVELTESSVISNIEESIKKMHLIKAMGVSIAIDDFGTGYSSLSMLKDLPVDELKIDRSFVNDFTQNPVDLTIVQTILQMGKNLNLRIVAEGVETESQMTYLSNYGCSLFQGYFFAKPCTINHFESKMDKQIKVMPKRANAKKTARKSIVLTKPSQALRSSNTFSTARLTINVSEKLKTKLNIT
jgi:diguanylate cyclase (GGDEF)-like protein/PAS domain S-box-containing protein